MSSTSASVIHFEVDKQEYGRLTDGLKRENAKRAEPLSKNSFAKMVMIEGLTGRGL